MHVYTLDDPSMDHLECRRSMNMLPLWFTALLADFWRESAPIVIAGGFPAHVMGYTTQYGDIDVFMHRKILASFISRYCGCVNVCGVVIIFIYRIRGNTNNMGHLAVQEEHTSVYPHSFTVYNLWIGATKTDIQVYSNAFLELVYQYEKQVIVVDAPSPSTNPYSFVNNVLDQFDLDISRMAIYNHTYYKR
jgi:hypothetical protein